MASKEYIEGLKLTIEHLHKCAAHYLRTESVRQTFQGKTVWHGDVEIFGLCGHPKPKRCYGWTYGGPEQFITILELPPVDSAQSAVKVGVAYQIRNA